MSSIRPFKYFVVTYTTLVCCEFTLSVEITYSFILLVKIVNIAI